MSLFNTNVIVTFESLSENDKSITFESPVFATKVNTVRKKETTTQETLFLVYYNGFMWVDMQKCTLPEGKPVTENIKKKKGKK